MIMLKKRIIELDKNPLTWVLLLALGIRLYACLTTYIVNPDGVHYIHQARAIYYNDWDSLTNCHLKYLSILPFLIALAFGVFRDWIIAGRFVSLFFGFATLIPLYFILRRYLDKTLSVITLLVYALIPVFVSRSAGIVRDPVFWFFLCAGMLMFVRHRDEDIKGRYRLDLFLSCFCFLVAMWARMEGILFIAVSGFYLLIAKTDRKKERLFFFFAPILLIGLVGLAYSFAVGGTGVNYHRMSEIRDELTSFTSNYETVRAQLKTITSQGFEYVDEFIRQVRKIVWLIPFSMIFDTILEGFYYPYALIFLLGFIGIRRRVSQNRRLGYFLWLSFFSIVILYIHLLRTWLIYHRFLAILIFPSCLVIGFGIDNIIQFMRKKFNLKLQLAIGVVVAFILLFGLPKNLQPNEKDKVIYRQAGEIIAQQKMPDQVARITAAYSTVYEWVFFYAHLDYPAPLCAKPLSGEIAGAYDQFLATLKKDKVRYVLYEEKEWPLEQIDLMNSPYQQDFQVLGKWWHKDTGDLILLGLK